MKKCLAAGLAILLLLTACSNEKSMITAELPVLLTEPLVSNIVMENDALSMTFDSETGAISLTDKRNGNIYSSTPANIDEDKVAKGLAKQEAKSQLSISYMDASGQTLSANSQSANAQTGWEYKDGEFTVTYHFEALGFSIPLVYTLDGSSFIATVIGKDIRILGENSLMSISVLPFFGATDENGFMFIPDGSGATIDINGETSYQSYSKPIYGRDPTLATLKLAETSQTISLPVFGLSSEKGGFFAIVTDGAAQGSITAEVSGKRTGFATVYSQIAVTQTETARFMEGTSNETNMPVYSDFTPPKVYTVKYTFLVKGKNSVTDMADIYRDYLKLTKTPISDYSIGLDIYSAIPMKKSFLGVPYIAAETLTTDKELFDIASAFDNNVSIRLLGYQAGGINAKSQKKVKEPPNVPDNAEIFISNNFVNLYKSGNGLSSSFDAVKNISRAPAYQYAYMLSTGSRKTSRVPWYLIKPNTAAKRFVTFMSDAEQRSINISLQGISNMVYSDYERSSVIVRSETEKIFEEAISGTSAQMETPFAYAIPYARGITYAPVESSGFDTELLSVPFYSILLAGYMPLYGEPLNLRGDFEDYLLKCISAGVSPNFAFIGGNPTKLLDTEYTWLYGADFGFWCDNVSQISERLSKELALTVGKTIVGYRQIEEGVTETLYENNTAVYVNRSDKDITIDGVFVKAMDFAVKDSAVKGGGS